MMNKQFNLEQTFIDLIINISSDSEHIEYGVPYESCMKDLIKSISTLYYADYTFNFSLKYLTKEEYEKVNSREDESDLVAKRMVEKHFNKEMWKKQELKENE